MSRIGKKEIKIPAGVTVEIKDGLVTVSGPKGKLMQKLHPHVAVAQEDGVLKVTVKNPDEKSDNSLWGLFASLLINMIGGVVSGYEKKLEINGVGYKVSLTGNKLLFNVGYSHPVEFVLPAGSEAKVEKNIITISGIDKYIVGQVAANIKKIRKPEPYKGKGIKYLDEVLRKKAGKTSSK